MRRLLIKRLISIPVILFLLSILIFSLVLFLSPSERVAVFVSSGDALQNASLEELIEKYELDAPFYVQYAKWITGIARGDLGWSNAARMPISEVLAQRIPATIELLLAGQLIVFFGGIFLGTLAARHHNRFADHFVRVVTIIGVSLPEFVLALFLLVIFYVCFDLMPPEGWVWRPPMWSIPVSSSTTPGCISWTACSTDAWMSVPTPFGTSFYRQSPIPWEAWRPPCG